MTWLLTHAATIGAVALLAWLANGLRKALFKPWLQYVSHNAVPSKNGWFLTLKRQQLLPPWACVDEVWWVPQNIKTHYARRVLDGQEAWSESLESRLAALINIAECRKAETEELLKEEKRAN